MQGSQNVHNAGLVVLLGSGETSAGAGRMFESLAVQYPSPLHIAVLETPAGFELNADAVAGRIVAFLKTRLQNYALQVQSVPARKKGGAHSPDDPEIVTPLLNADIIFLGPGSPTYAARQLRDSLTWALVQARQREGAALVLASAAAIAASSQTLPVYEIFKVGEDLHWKPGLGLLEPYGLHLAIVPHWNNAEGGEALDTSRCFIGRARFAKLQERLAEDITVVGLDELTGLVIDLNAQTCRVTGVGSVHLLRRGEERIFEHDCMFPLALLGEFHELEDEFVGISHAARQMLAARLPMRPPAPDDAVLRLFEARNAARAAKDWVEADRLRGAIGELGWLVTDTPDGSRLTPTGG